jgi:hypothetical protein
LCESISEQKMTSLKATIHLVVLCLALPAAVRADDLADSLNQDYQNHVLGVRYPIHGGDQQFDSDGHPVNAGAAPEVGNLWRHPDRQGAS